MARANWKFIRQCKRCNKVFEASSNYCKICYDCDLRKGKATLRFNEVKL